jgi:hypothetical protein
MTEIIKATHEGILAIGSKELKCAVLENGIRVISRSTVFKAFDRPARGNIKAGTKRAANMPSFLDANNLQPHIHEELRNLIQEIPYKTKKGRDLKGFDARIIPLVCDVYLDAREANALTQSQEPQAKSAQTIVRSLSKIGIIALVDEATGYQEDRQRTELQQLLAAFISEELMPWTKRFPDEFYKQLFRLHGWQYNPMSVKRPQCVGKLTKSIVYERLSRDVLEDLEKKNPPNLNGNRQYKHHQFLTQDIGHPALDKHIAGLIALMRASTNKTSFERLLQRAYPKLGDDEQISLDLDLQDA